LVFLLGYLLHLLKKECRFERRRKRQLLENSERARKLVEIDRSYKGNDEFHTSLDMNLTAMLLMTPEEQEKYLTDLYFRRSRAHDKKSLKKDLLET
jgi:hypothetical protein